MPFCINKKHADWGLLVDRMMGSEMLADMCFRMYNAENQTEGQYPTRDFERRVLDDLYGKKVVIDDQSYESGDTEEQADRIEELLAGNDEAMDVPQFTSLEVQTKNPIRDTNVLSGEIKDIASKMEWKTGGDKGDKFSATGATAILSGEEYDPLRGPIKQSEETVHTHAGEFTHKTLEETANFFKDKKFSQRELTSFIRDNLDNFALPYGKMKLNENSKDKIAKNLSEMFAPILRNYDILGTEIKVQSKTAAGRAVRGAIDLMIKDKKTGAVGIVDFKTSAEQNFVGPSKFNKMADIGVPGSTAFDKVQMQTLLYKEIMNDKYRTETGKDEDLVNFRAMIPISMGIDSTTGEVFNMQGAEIPKGEELTKEQGGRLYGLFDTANYQQKVGEKFGLGAGAEKEAISLEKKFGNLKQLTRNIVSEAEKYGHTQIKKDVMAHLTGFNTDSDMPSILLASHKTMNYIRDYVANNKNDMNMLSKAYSNVDALETMEQSLFGSEMDKGVLSYVKDVLHMDPESEQAQAFMEQTMSGVEGFKEDLKNLKKTVMDAHRDYLQNNKLPDLAQTMLSTQIIPKLVDDQLNIIKENLMKEGKGKTYNRGIYEEEATQKAWEQYRANQKMYDKEAWGKAEAIFDATKAGPASMNLVDKIVNSTIFRKLSPINQNPDLLVKDTVRTVLEGRNKVADMVRQSKQKILPVAAEVEKLANGKTSKEAYDFMFKYNDKISKTGETWNMASIVQEFDMTKLENDRKAFYNDMVKKNLSREELREKMDEWDRGNHELTVPEEQASDTIRDNIIDKLQEVKSHGLIDEDGYQEAIKYIQTHGDMLTSLPEAFTDPKSEMYAKNASEYVRKVYDEAKAEVYRPIGTYKDAKFEAIMKMDANDPRRKFYEMYRDTARLYDLVVPPIKRLGGNLPSMYATAREQTGFLSKISARQRDMLRDQYQQSKDGIKLFGKDFGTPEHTQKWFGKSDDFDRQSKSFEWTSRVPLAFSGYSVDPNAQSYNMGDALLAIESSLNNYMTFMPRVAEMEMMCDTYEKAGITYNPLRGTLHKTSNANTRQMRMVLEKMVYGGGKNGGKAMQLLRGYLGWESFKALGYGSMIALRSHFASWSTIATNFTGEGEALGGKEALQSYASLMTGNKKQGKVYDYAGLGDNQEVMQVLKNIQKPGIAGQLMNLGFLPYSWSDTFHRRTVAENFTRKNHCFDANGNDLGSIYDMLTEDKNGKLQIDPRVKYLDKYRSVKYSQEGVAREIQRICSVTTAPITDLDKPEFSLDPSGRMSTMTKNIGINTMSDMLQSANYDPVSGRIRQGALNVLADKGGFTGALGSILQIRNMARVVDYIGGLTGSNPGMLGRIGALGGRDLKPHQLAAIRRLSKQVWTMAAITATKQLLLPTIAANYFDNDDAQDKVKDTLDPDEQNAKTWMKNTSWLVCNAMNTAINPFEPFNLYSDLNPGGMAWQSAKSYFKVLSDVGDIIQAKREGDDIPTVGNSTLVGFTPDETPKIYEDIFKATGFLTQLSKPLQPYKSVNFYLHKQD